MLANCWLLIIAFCIIMYVILDGFTLGIGMLLVLLKDEDRTIATTAILPNWDGNQTWLVLGMACLYGAFPMAFGILLPFLYLPLLTLVIALLLRGVVFEFRMKSEKGQPLWDIIFSGSSLVVASTQGYILGIFVQGFSKDASLAFDIMTGIGLVFGYSLLGTTRLILKTEHNLQSKMFRLSRHLGFILLGLIGIVSIWTPFVYPLLKQRWFNPELMPYLAILPTINILIFIFLQIMIRKRNDHWPYWLSVAFFLCPYIGFLISVYPYIVPYSITLWQAAAPKSSLQFTLVGTLIMLPLLLAYTFYSYYIFRGKVRDTFHY